jgi:hypothetical protein
VCTIAGKLAFGSRRDPVDSLSLVDAQDLGRGTPPMNTERACQITRGGGENTPAPVTVGKKNTLNNFCIGIRSDRPGCTSCHAGFVLEIAGFGNSSKLAAQFYFQEMTVLKVMFTAIVVAMVLIFLSSALGMLDYNLIWVNPTYLWPGIVGGLIMGIGFIIGGFCPGTSLVAMSTFKVDGLFYVLGAVFGIFLFGETVDLFDIFWNSSYMGRSTIPKVVGLPTGPGCPARCSHGALHVLGFGAIGTDIQEERCPEPTQAGICVCRDALGGCPEGPDSRPASDDGSLGTDCG